MAAIFTAVAMISVASADDATARYYEGLRTRGLFRLAESACRRQLASDDVSAEQRSALTLELSRTLAERAKYATGKEQAELWQQATDVIDKLLASQPRPPRPEWLELQRAIVLVLRGEFRRWEADLAPFDEKIRDDAVTQLTSAVAALQKLDSLFSGKSTPTGDRAELYRHVHYQLAIAWINKAELSPAGSTVRRALAQTADKTLASLTTGEIKDAITWNSRLLRAVASRLQDNPEEAVDRLAALERMKPPVSIVDRTVAERVRLLLGQNTPDPAEKMLVAYRKLRGGLPGELALLKMRASLAQWNAARKFGDADRAAKLIKQAESDAADAEQTVGGYWAYRCRLLLSYLKDAGLHGPELAATLRKAQSAFLQKNLAKAATEYLAAVSLAEKSGDKKMTADLLYTAGSVQLRANDYEAAAKTLQKLAADFPQHPRAASANLLAAYCLGRHYETLRSGPRRLAYTAALESHRKRFPNDATTHEAAWMLAALHEYRRQTSKALELYLTIPADHARGLDAPAAAARCYEEIIDRLRELKKAERAAWEKHAVAQIGGFIRAFPASPKTINAQQAEIALRYARIQLNRSTPDYQQADAVLDRVLAAGKAAESQSSLSQSDKAFWQAAVRNGRQLRVVALAGSGKFEDAKSLVAGLSQTGPAEVLAVLDGLMKLGSDGDPAVREKLGSLQMGAALELNRRRDKLNPAEQAWLDRCLAQAYAVTGRGEQAVDLYEKQLEKDPRNKSLLKTTASLLLKAGDRDSLKKAKAHWRKLESLEKTGTEPWLAARYHVALSSYRLGEYDEARKLVRLTTLLYPKLGSDELRKQFASLQADLQKTR